MPGRLACDLGTLKPPGRGVLFWCIARNFVYYTLWALLWARAVIWSELPDASMVFKPLFLLERPAFLSKQQTFVWVQTGVKLSNYCCPVSYLVLGIYPASKETLTSSHEAAWWHSQGVPQSVIDSDTWNHLRFTTHFVNLGKLWYFQT